MSVTILATAPTTSILGLCCNRAIELLRNQNKIGKKCLTEKSLTREMWLAPDNLEADLPGIGELTYRRAAM